MFRFSYHSGVRVIREIIVIICTIIMIFFLFFAANLLYRIGTTKKCAQTYLRMRILFGGTGRKRKILSTIRPHGAATECTQTVVAAAVHVILVNATNDHKKKKKIRKKKRITTSQRDFIYNIM